MEFFLDRIKTKAKTNKKRIVLPEGGEKRILTAASKIIEEGFADVILIGNRENLIHLGSEYYLNNIEKATIVDPLNNPKAEEYIELMLRLRGSKGLTREQAGEQLKDPLYLAAVMVKAGDADGEVAGAVNTTSNVLRPAFQYVKTKPGISVVSGAFVMILKDTMFGENGMMVFADCAVHPNPNAEELAEIAIVTARTTREITGMEPRVAMLSFSTKGSAKNEMADKVIEATRIVKEKEPTLLIDGELQADAAIVPGIAASKAPGSPVAGLANVLVFPSLDVGNIAYKLVQRMAHAVAIGPILQGMASPINDLSRGCSVDDIISTVAITACQAADGGK